MMIYFRKNINRFWPRNLSKIGLYKKNLFDFTGKIGKHIKIYIKKKISHKKI